MLFFLFLFLRTVMNKIIIIRLIEHYKNEHKMEKKNYMCIIKTVQFVITCNFNKATSQLGKLN